ncbi:MAG TPA: H(+)/Cl(-) exchange transporter ClcA [Candidatus Eisenbacteria bacterium]|nr:H(+)/Cl(-) exchange transporter ClcA [Candidatus Eisenbacteria bacterium]
MSDRSPEPSSAGDATSRAAEVVQREVRDFVRAHERRRRQLPRAIVVGLLAGITAVAFTRVLAEADDLRTTFIAWAHTLGPWGFAFPVSLAALGAGAAVGLVRRMAPEASGSGIPQLEAVLHHLRPMRGARVLAVKFIGGVLGIGGGLALGREGPTIQMGGALGQLTSQWFRCTPRERQTLIAAGAGAGLAAAFNAPLAGLVFVLEEVQRDFSPTVFTTTLIAAVTADVVTRLLIGQLPVFHVRTESIPPLQVLPVALLVGAAAGLFGVAFNRALVGALDLFQRLGNGLSWASGAVAGAVVGGAGWFVPIALGGGHGLVEQTLAGALALPALAGSFVLRFALTMLSYGSGAPGGIFAPLLVLGSQLGLGVGLLAQHVVPSAVEHPALFAVVGMAAYFTAIVRAPLTGIVLMVEMTGNYSLVLPLLGACLTAYGMADALGDRPVYEALLERDLLRGEPMSNLESALLLELTLAAGAPFEGQRIREIGLPPGCVIVTVSRKTGEHVPTGDFRLEAGDRLTAVVAADAPAAAALLRSGVNGDRR